MIREELLHLLEETFESHHGIYTDKGTSFFETLQGVDHRQASRPYPGMPETIAGHVFHTRFYIVVLKEYITGARTGKTDWRQSWTVQSVTPGEWEALKTEFDTEYRNLLRFLREDFRWDEADHFGGLLAIAAHCAYHLGAVRQLIERP